MKPGFDLRAPLLAVLAWVAAFCGLVGSPGLGLLGLPVGFWLWRRRRLDRSWVTPACWAVSAFAVFSSAALQRAAVDEGQLSRLAQTQASVRVVAVVDTTPKPVTGRFARRVFFNATVVEVDLPSRRFTMRSRSRCSRLRWRCRAAPGSGCRACCGLRTAQGSPR